MMKRFQLAYEPNKPSVRAIRKQIKDAIEQEVNSFTQGNGVIYEMSAIRRITAFRQALEILPKK